jgi:nucleotide-binding universal stress UspA family protein
MANSTTSTIVVGIDGSPESVAALRWALTEAVTAGSEVEVVHCWHALSVRDVAFGSSHELHNASICMLDNEVKAALKDLGNPPPIVQTSVNARPGTVLVARSKHAEMLVLGAHGRTSLHDIVFGQVEASARRHAQCPVVVVDRNGKATRHAVPENAVAAR